MPVAFPRFKTSKIEKNQCHCLPDEEKLQVHIWEDFEAVGPRFEWEKYRDRVLGEM